MLVIAGHIEIDPANREAAIAAAREMAEATRREAGCVAYVFSADLDDPGVFRLFEEWESQAALDEHFKTAHMAEFQKQIGSLGVKEMNIKKYVVSSGGSLF